MAALMFIIDNLVPDGVLGFYWATAANTALLLLDVSTEMGEFFRLCDAASKDIETRRRRRRLVSRTALSTCGWCLTGYFGTGVLIAFFTQHMDRRMYSILHGLSALEAAVVLLFISTEAPKLIGVYHSSSSKSYLAGRRHLLVSAEAIGGEDEAQADKVLASHVRWSLVQRFGITYFLLLPFVGKSLAFMMGILIGFFIDLWLFAARRLTANSPLQIFLAYFLGLDLAVASAVFFSNSCNYIQTVWNIRYITSEQGLKWGAFIIWFTVLGVLHLSLYMETNSIIRAQRRISTAARGERLATSLIVNKLKEQMEVSEAVLNDLSEASETYGALSSSMNFEGSGNEPPIFSPEFEPVEATKLEVGYRWVQRSLWGASVFLSLLLVTSNIGATYQMNKVRERLPMVESTLYDNINEIAVCGLDVTSKEVKTFDTLEEAHSAGFGVAHCGPCGACSTYHNLRLQYTTKSYLADESAMCARRSLYGGRPASLECLEDDPKIGFEPACAECWVDDILCAKDHCMFIFLQSAFINKISNFEVSADDITSATCEEAMCELDFVPCSGATRRRMHIESDIARPENQQCTLVDFDWKEMFGDT